MKRAETLHYYILAKLVTSVREFIGNFVIYILIPAESSIILRTKVEKLEFAFR